MPHLFPAFLQDQQQSFQFLVFCYDYENQIRLVGHKQQVLFLGLNYHESDAKIYI